MRKEMTMAAEKIPKETVPSQKGAETGDDDHEENGEEADTLLLGSMYIWSLLNQLNRS